MKNRTNTITLIFFAINFILVLISQYVVITYSKPENLIKNAGIASFFFIFFNTFLIYISLKRYKQESKDYQKSLLSKIDELFKSNEKYDLVSKATSDTIWDWDLKTNKFVWSKGIEDVFGYKKEDVDENLQWWFDHIHAEDSLKMSVRLYSFIAEKSEKWQDQYRFLCADGTFKYVNDRGFLVKDETDNIVRMIGAIQDITKQKEEEIRLKLLETVITNTKDTIIITEELKVKNGIPKIVYVNPAFKNLTGYNEDEIIGTNPSIFLTKNSTKDDISKISNAIKKNEEYFFVSENTTKNGENYWMNFSMIPIINKEKKTTHWIAILRDITKEKEKELEREKLISELTQNYKDLKQFSYITSHNLRAPLSNLTGLLNLIDDIKIEDEELIEIINGFSKSTAHLNETVNDLISVIVIKDNQSINREETNINHSINNLINQLTFSIAEKKPIINIDLGNSEKVIINKSYLESILLNLMTNSLKFNDKNKNLEISITAEKTENNTIITFSDNGIGIDLEKNGEKIFGLYQRFHDYPDSKGLGLYLVKSQVESMGGTIEIESKVTIGTKFIITFKNNQ